jgi:hypothetical protein
MANIAANIRCQKRPVFPGPRHLHCLIWMGLFLAVSAALGGCGTYVPNIPEFNGDPVSEQQLVQKIIQAVTCEVRDAVNNFYARQQRQHLFIDNWGAQLTLTLTVEERSEFNPTAIWTPNGMLSLFGAADVSADATRIDTINSFHTVREIRMFEPCSPEERPVGPFLLESDLKLENLLFDSQTAADIRQVNFAETGRAASGKDVIQHEVKFIVTTSGNINPTLKLSRVWVVNPSGLFLAALRNRTQDLLITFGPTDITGTNLAPAAASIALSSQIGIAVSNSLRTMTLP